MRPEIMSALKIVSLYVNAKSATIAQESPHYKFTILSLFGGEIIFEVFQPM